VAENGYRRTLFKLDKTRCGRGGHSIGEGLFGRGEHEEGCYVLVHRCSTKTKMPLQGKGGIVRTRKIIKKIGVSGEMDLRPPRMFTGKSNAKRNFGTKKL